MAATWVPCPTRSAAPAAYRQSPAHGTTDTAAGNVNSFRLVTGIVTPFPRPAGNRPPAVPACPPCERAKVLAANRKQTSRAGQRESSTSPILGFRTPQLTGSQTNRFTDETVHNSGGSPIIYAAVV